MAQSRSRGSSRTSASRTSVITPSSTQRAVSSAWMPSRRCLSSVVSIEVRVELARLEIGQARPELLRPALRIVVEPLAVLASEAAALLHHLFQQRLLARLDRHRRRDRPRSLSNLHARSTATSSLSASGPTGIPAMRRDSRSSPPARPRPASGGLRADRCRPHAKCRNRANR